MRSFSAVSEAVLVAQNGYLVTIGIAPRPPSTGFGYVRLGDRLGMPDAPNARLVLSFKEKPDARTVAAYIATGSYRWNAGMFVTKVSFLMDLLREYKPELAEGLTRIAAVWDVDDVQRNKLLEEIWPGLEKIANRTVVTFLSYCHRILNNMSTLDAYCDNRHPLFYDYCIGRDYSELSHSNLSQAVLYRVSEYG